MIAIEHNPTKPGLNRLEKPWAPENPKKGRKNDGLGGFAKILAGLISKKTQPEAVMFRKASALNEGKEKALHLAGGKQRQLPLEKDTDAVSFLKGKKQKETARQSGVETTIALLQTNPVKTMPVDKADKENSFVSRPVLLKDNLEQQNNPVKHRLPFQNREKPGVSDGKEALNAHLNSGANPGLRPKKEAIPTTENKPDSKRTERRRDRTSVEVYDLRTQTGSESGLIAEHGLKGAEKIRNHAETEIVLDLRPVGERHEGTAGTENKAVQGGENFARVLARELNGDLSTDIVKQATLILRDGGEGTIKLSLKPESLGKVKIHLEMAENKILGHIVVESEEALRAFEQEIHTLEQAFKDSGFEASLNAALDYRNDGQRAGPGWKEKEAGGPFFSERLAASYEESAEFQGGFNFGFGLSTVNMLV